MHSYCAPCLSKCVVTVGPDAGVVCPSCKEVTPPPPPGRTIQQAFPDNVSDAGTPALCYDCVGEEKAVATCLECQAHFCQAHAESHPKSRANHNHQLRSLHSDGSSEQHNKQRVENCSVHPGRQLQSFCSQCRDLLCQECETIHPSEHKRRVLPVPEAVSLFKQSLTIQMADFAETHVLNVQRVINEHRKVIESFDSQQAALKQKIKVYFRGLMNAIALREQEVLEELDQLCISKQHSLEAGLLRISNYTAAYSTAIACLASSQPDTNFLKMYPWLHEILVGKSQKTVNICDPPASTELVCTFNTTVGKHRTIDLRQVARKLGKIAEKTASTSGIPALPRPEVHAADVSSMDGTQGIISSFDPAMCHTSIGLSNQCRTATVMGFGTRDRCVLGATLYNTGQHDIHVRIDDGQGYSTIVVGMTASADPPLDKDDHGLGLSAWDGFRKHATGPCSTKWQLGCDVGQPWHDGDVLRMHLDCEKHTLSALHERTGKAHTINNVTGDLRLFIVLYKTDHKVSILK